MALISTLTLRQRALLLRMSVGVVLGAGVLCVYLLQTPLLLQTDRHIYDIFLRATAGTPPSPAPAIVDIDEASLAQYGQWPWPRHLMATLLKKITEAGAAAIGIDILLAEPDRTSPARLRESLQEHFGVQIAIEGLPAHLDDNDALLAFVLQQTPVVLGVFSRFGARETAPAHTSGIAETDMPITEGVVERTLPGAPSPRTTVFRAHDATLPIPVLRGTAPIGTINVAPDPDGVVRDVPLVSLWRDRILPSLAVRTLMRGLGVSTLTLVSTMDGLAAVRIGPYTVPVTPQGLYAVPFRGGRHTYPYVSAKDILQDRIPKEDMHGRILFIGTSAPGLLDLRTTPLDRIFPGVEVHAAIADNILSNRAIIRPVWTPGVQALAIVCAGIVVTLLLSLATPLVYLPVTAALAGGSVAGSWYMFEQGVFFSPLYGVVTVILLAVGILAVRFWQETRQRRLLRRSFSRYVASDMVDRIVERGEAVLHGEEREVTLMFTDIRGFTSLSEKLAPAQVVDMLNRYFTPMTAVIRDSGGTVDKFIGDAIMAFWNAPLDVPQHQVRAVTSALRMQAALDILNTALDAELGLTLRMGIGVHTGKVYVGNMGSAELLDYTCIGDTVNLTSRLEGQCPTYGVPVVVSEATVSQCEAVTHIQDMPVFVHLDDIRVKGKEQPVGIYTALTPADFHETQHQWQAFAQARTLYVAGDFAGAGASFDALNAARPEHILFALYAERCRALCKQTPEVWDGVWVWKSK